MIQISLSNLVFNTSYPARRHGKTRAGGRIHARGLGRQTPRDTLEDLEPMIDALKVHIDELEIELAAFRIAEH